MQKFMQTLRTKKDSMLESIKNKEGFTLIELIVVMAIIAILVLLAAPQFLGYTKDAQATAVRQDTKVLSDAALQYHIDEEGFPTGEVATIPTDLETKVSGEAVVLTEDALKKYVKSIKNEYTEYGLITTGDDQGTVFHLTGVDDKDNNKVFGIGNDFVVEASETP